MPQDSSPVHHTESIPVLTQNSTVCAGVRLGAFLTCRTFVNKLANKHRLNVSSPGYAVFYFLELLPCGSLLILNYRDPLICDTLSVSNNNNNNKKGRKTWGCGEERKSLGWPGNAFVFHQVSWLCSHSAFGIHQVHVSSSCFIILSSGGYGTFWRRQREM